MIKPTMSLATSKAKKIYGLKEKQFILYRLSLIIKLHKLIIMRGKKGLLFIIESNLDYNKFIKKRFFYVFKIFIFKNNFFIK